MSGEQGTIRAIRVIGGENGLHDWPQKGAEGRKKGANPNVCGCLYPIAEVMLYPLP